MDEGKLYLDMPPNRAELAAGAWGAPGKRLLAYNMDPGCLRPFKEVDKFGRPTGRSLITLNAGTPHQRTVYTNAAALLTKEAWMRIDREIMWQAKKRLRFWDDLESANKYTVPDGLGTLMIQHTIADTDASVHIGMDPVRRGERSRTKEDFGFLPLPVIWSDGNWGIRDLAVARKGDLPLNETGIKSAGRKMGEFLEQWSLGSLGEYKFNNATVYGLGNVPSRITSSTLTLPTTGGWTPKTFIDQILAAIKALEDNFFYGPYIMYHSNGWGPYFDSDYVGTYPKSFRSRLREIGKISDVRNLDYLADYQVFLVQMTPDVAEAVSGMEISTVQWDEASGMESFWRIWTIKVPRFRANFAGNTGVNHMTAS